jgi:hypothetical protein
MANITKHDAIFKGKGNYSEDGWIGLLIRRNTIGIYYFLENYCEIICFEHGGRFDRMVRNLFESWWINIPIFLFNLINHTEGIFLLTFGNPTEAHAEFVSKFHLV